MSPARAIGLFLLVTFGISWGLVGITLTVYPAVFEQPALLIPLFFLGVYAPAIAAFVNADEREDGAQQGRDWSLTAGVEGSYCLADAE
jgi:drug/metabolite transporter (DMT)-like permease